MTGRQLVYSRRLFHSQIREISSTHIIQDHITAECRRKDTCMSRSFSLYIDRIIISYVKSVKGDYDLPLVQRDLLIIDCFCGQFVDEFTAKLSGNCLIYITVSLYCTNILQKMGLSVNKSAKSFLKSEFEN